MCYRKKTIQSKKLSLGLKLGAISGAWFSEGRLSTLVIYEQCWLGQESTPRPNSRTVFYFC